MVYTKSELLKIIKKMNTKTEFIFDEFLDNDLKSNYIDYIQNKDIQALDKLLNEDDISDKDISDDGTIVKKYNFELLVLKNTNIYRSYIGFVTREAEKIFYKNNNKQLVYLSNKYFCYFVAREFWGSVSSYKVNKKLVLLDFFNVNNIDNIIKLSQTKIPDIKERKTFIKCLKKI
jgi:hypothetical protein